MINTCHATIRKNPDPSLQNGKCLAAHYQIFGKQIYININIHTYIRTYINVCMYTKHFFLVIRFHHRMQIWHTINAKYIFYPQCLHVKHIDVKKFTLND